MATKKLKGLGMGLEALLGPTVVDAPPALAGEGGAPSALPLDDLVAGQY
ncbi:MAG: chromosome partitioning protein ParB, partial [Betaproteobacteria bacterium]|nr:chromosome partitioning protein ParB [Betaproteobacteria bacterium]